jgi:hypothetical protein
MTGPGIGTYTVSPQSLEVEFSTEAIIHAVNHQAISLYSNINFIIFLMIYL